MADPVAPDGPLVQAKMEELMWVWLNSPSTSNFFRDMGGSTIPTPTPLVSPRRQIRADKCASPPVRADKCRTVGPSTFERVEINPKSQTMHTLTATCESEIPPGAFAYRSEIAKPSAEALESARQFIRALPNKRVTKPEQLESFLTNCMGMSRFFADVLYHKISLNVVGENNDTGFTEEAMISWAKSSWDTQRDVVTFYHLMKSPVNNWIEKDDFRTLLDTILDKLASLDFLKATPEFQQRYAETV